MVEKILLIGRAGMGKTTIKKVILEGEDPNDLILFPLEATIGTKYSIHDFIDLKISLLDTAGQSLSILLEDEDKQAEIFENSSVIIYIFDYNVWMAQPQVIIDEIKTIFNINKKNEFGAKIFLFLHKIDLLIQKTRSNLNLLKKRIINQLDLHEKLPIYFTSLHPNLIYRLYNAFYDTLSTFSTEITSLKGILNNIINDLSKTISFITNQNNNIVVHSMTKDFDSNLIYDLHEKIYQLNKIPEGVSSNPNLIDLISKILFIKIENIRNINPNLKKAIFLSETLNQNKLNELIDKLKIDLIKHYKGE